MLNYIFFFDMKDSIDSRRCLPLHRWSSGRTMPCNPSLIQSLPPGWTLRKRGLRSGSWCFSPCWLLTGTDTYMMYVNIHTQRPDEDMCILLYHSALLCWHKVSLKLKLDWRPKISSNPPLSQCWGYRCKRPHPQFDMGSGDPKLSPSCLYSEASYPLCHLFSPRNRYLKPKTSTFSFSMQTLPPLIFNHIPLRYMDWQVV